MFIRASRRLLFRFRPGNQFIGMDGGEIVREKLRDFGIDHVFGYCGGCNLPILNGFYGSINPLFLPACTEAGAGFMATGYAKSRGIPGVAVTTSGPGMTNIVTSIYDANADHVPLIVLSGQVSQSAIGTDAFQEAPSLELAKAKNISKWAYRIQSVDELPSAMDNAYRVAMDGVKGVAFLDLPKDLMVQRLRNSVEVEDEALTGCKTVPKRVCARDVSQVADLINGSERPVIFVGQGAKAAHHLVRHLAHKTWIPVTSTLHGLGIFDGRHELSLRMVGMHGSAAANYAIQEADLIIGIGARFDDRTIGTVGSYAPMAKKAYESGKGGIISINLEPIKTVKPHFCFNYDCRTFLTHLIPCVHNKSRWSWMERVRDLKREYPFEYSSSPDELKVQDVLVELNRALHGRDFVMATGVGNHQMMASSLVDFRSPNRLLTSGSSGTMGVCAPYLIGSHYAHKYRGQGVPLLIGVDGDGSFNMTMSELQMVSSERIPVKHFIMNDGQLQMVNVWQKKFFNKRFIGTDSHNPDYVKLGEAWGIKVVRVTDRRELLEALNLLDSPEPILFDCKVAKDQECLPMVAPGKPLHDMILHRNQLKFMAFDSSQTPA